MSEFRVGVDIGGTFTDIVFLGADGKVVTKKVSSTVDDYARAIVDGLAEVYEEQQLAGADIAELLHGTTVGSNAILEAKGARTGLITTEGFRDVLEIRTLRMPRLYDLHWEKPMPLIERYLRRTVKERVDSEGNVKDALDPAEAERVVQTLLDEKVEAIAVCLLNAYANPVHERAIAEIIRAKAPDLPFCISFDVLPEMKEYERTSTTVINTYIMPIVKGYLESLRRELDAGGTAAPLLLMQSNGGLMTSEAATRLPANIVESGPAGGVVGAQALSRKLDMPDLITFDMGGTTAKASLIEKTEVTRSLEYQVGGGIMIGSRLMTGGGYTLKVPAIDLAEVGAGGGSIITIDAGGSMQVGPQSAGAFPGPVCYDQGGTEPTVTDANVVLGYINPAHLVGGALTLNPDKSRQVLEEKVAKPVGLEVAHAAYGAHQIAASNMIRAIKAVSSERGRDPRRYAMLAFGGNGPLFAAGMAKALRMTRIVIPPSPGLFSSFGLLYADVEHHYSRTVRRVLRDSDPALLNAAWQELEDQAREQLAVDGFSDGQMRFRRAANMHYKGQIFELTVPAPDGVIDAAAVATLEEAFGQEHEVTYGHRAGPEEPVELVNAMVVGQGIPDRPRVPDRLINEAAAGAKLPPRQAYFGPEAGWIETPVIRRADLVSAHTGPCIVEEYDATCLVPPEATASLDSYGNIVIELKD
ncbi:MAG: hydantoinase/oxoprolinase family protein [Rhodospirillaceae bacterium]|nr:hydantoinase/oxoprolinase family protein [Rhodospirillaceae bacterium]MDD9924997.1 hydantoinase/oxoprolinase family protein [Rhodospirillaceae bacterium]